MNLLKRANEYFRQGKYEEAYELYSQAKILYKFDFLDFNLTLCEKRARKTFKKNHKIIDILIPVYNALEDVKNCIDSIYRHKTYEFNLIVIDDCSGSETKEYLKKESNLKGFKLLRNEENLRFTKTVNRGFQESTGDYVVLLNSDTIVTAGWIEKILTCFKSDERIGIVGPLSNAASWQTVPVRNNVAGGWLVNEIPEGYSVDEMGMLVEVVSKKIYPQVPSVNGFCYVIKREVLSRNGLLDEKYFPTGYGEEDDFSIRAIDAGFKIAVADDTYIFHAKSKSYTHEKRKIFSAKGRKALDAKHGAQRLKSLVDAWKAEPSLAKIARNIESYMHESLRNKKIVYTAIFGDYDTLKKPEYVNKDWDYVCFTNNKSLVSDVFIIKHVDAVYKNQTKNARMIKLLSHIFLIGYKYSLWIDGNVILRGRNINELIEGMREEDYIAVHQHVKRQCVYEELTACISAKKDDQGIMIKQVEKYREEGMPEQYGLLETAELLRKHCQNGKKINMLWWDQLNSFSIRDQLALPYILWKYNFKYKKMKGVQWLDPYFNIYKHNKDLKIKENRLYYPKVTIVVIVNSIVDIEFMIAKLIQITEYKNFDIIMTNTNGNEDLMSKLKSLKKAYVNLDTVESCLNMSLVEAKNYISRKTNSELLCFLDENCEIIESSWLRQLVYQFIEECTAITGSSILNEDYNIVSNGVNVKNINGNFIEAKNRNKLGGTGNVYAVSEKCIVVRNSFLEEVNYFNEKLDNRNATIDLCLKYLTNNKSIRFVLNSQVIDHKPTNEKDQIISSHKLKKLWSGSSVFEKNLNNLECKKKICIIPQCQTSGKYTATGFIRLILPYSILKKNYNLKVLITLNDLLLFKPDVVIIQRYSISISDFKNIRNTLKGSKIIYDIDDDLIKFFESDKDKQNIIKYLLSNSDIVTVSTENLRREYIKYNYNIKKIDNLLSLNVWKNTLALEKSYERINILYMGSKSHHKDFLLVEDDLIRLKKVYGNQLSIDIIGVMDKCMYSKSEYFNYIEPPELAREQYDQFVKWIAQENRWHIGIAPLEDNEFNRKKSYIKFLDYSALGLVTVASKIVPYTDIIEDKKNGILVADNETWFEKISELVRDIGEMKKISQYAYQNFKENHIISSGEILTTVIEE